MHTTTSNKIRELRGILGQTQGAFAATVGVSKDAVASWEIGRNRLSPWMARRLALATGVDEFSLLRAGTPLRTLELPRQPFTLEEFRKHQKLFWGGNSDKNAAWHAQRCLETLELLFRAAARTRAGSRLPGVLGAFIQWGHEARRDFRLEKPIDAILAERKAPLELNKTYGQWREMARVDPEMTRKFGFKDDPEREGREALTLSLETIPVWMPGHSMRGGRRG